MDRLRQTAFTLIELLLVIAIIILLVGVSVPAMNYYLKTQSLEAAGRIIKGALHEARQGAVSRKVPFIVVLFSEQDGEGLVYGVRVFEVGRGYRSDPQYLSGHLEMPVGAGGELHEASGIRIISGGAPAPGTQRFEELLGPGSQAEGMIRFLPGSGELDTTRFEDQSPTYEGQSVFDPNANIPALPRDIPADLKVRSPNAGRVMVIDLQPSGLPKARLFKESR